MRYVGDAIADADIHYSHDGGLIFPLVYQAKPTVISLRSIIYPETLQCAFLFQGDEWILPSEHTRASYAAAVSQFAPEAPARMHTIHNGFDWDLYRFTPPSAIFEVIPAEVAEHKVMLFPHRPDTNKGIYEVVQVARRLVHELGWADLRVLAPRWLDADSDSLNIAYYEKLRRTISEAGLDGVFVFHDWISEALISEYYSLADVTMCIGSCVETFGNTPFESLGCGTLPIVSRVATYRDLLPDEHIDRVDYGDIDAAAALAHAILSDGSRTSAATLDYLKSAYSHEAMVSRFADVILNAVKKPPLQYRLPELEESTIFKLAPWCYISPDRGIYHDFHAAYKRDDELVNLAHENPSGFPASTVAPERLNAWVDDGYIVPIVSA